MTAAWDEFVRAHGEVIGYDLGGVFIPVEPGNTRALRIREAVAANFPQSLGMPVYRPKAGAIGEYS